MQNKQTKLAFLKYSLLNTLKTPSFYILAILFTVFCNANYFIRQQFFGGSGTTDLLLYFTIVPYISIIIIPSLCYKLSFTIYDDFIPLAHISKIILTFLADYILYTVLILLLLPGALFVNLFGSIDGGQLFTSIICLLFYGAAVISVCIFIQTIISNKISAFICSAIVLAIFNSAHLFTVYVQLPQVLVTICKQLSFAWHFDAAGKGIIDSRDLLWLLGTALLFIALTDITTLLKRGKQFLPQLKLRCLCTVLLSVLIMLNGSRWYLRFDLSKNKTYSASKYTKQLVKNVERPLKITYYRSSSISKLYPQIRDVSDFLTEYCSLGKNISLLIKDPDKDPATKTLLENYGIASQQLRSVKNTSTEYTNVYSAIVMEYDGFREIIPFTMAANTLEYDLDGRLNHLVFGKERTVNIVIGNGMSLNEDYGYVIPWLSSQGFICNPLFVEDPSFADEISKTTGPLLVIGDSQLKIDAAIAIEAYILNGKGNALFMVSPFSVNIEEDWNLTQNKYTNVVEMLENWGITFTNNIAADISCSRITMYSDDDHTEVLNYPLWPQLLQQQNAPLGITLFWPTVLETDAQTPYLLSSPAAYFYQIDKNSPEKLIETNPFILKTMNTLDKQKGNLILGAQITGSLNGLYNLAHCENSNIIVIPDQYFVNSLMTGYIGGETGDYRNFEFMTNSLLKLNGESELAALQSRTTRDTSFYKITDVNQFIRLQFILYLSLFALIPVLIIAGGVYFYVKKD